MNWQIVFEQNRTALLGLVAVMLGMLPEGGTILRAAKRRVLEILLPSEACLRRLIVILTRNMAVPAVVEAVVPSLPPSAVSCGGAKVPVFALFDPRRLVGVERHRGPAYEPRISDFESWVSRPRKAIPTDDDALDTARLRRRIEAMHRALDDLPRQARRLMRVIAKRKHAGVRKRRPMRPGRPPGHRADGKRIVDEMLANLNDLALWVMHEPPPDWVVADRS